MRIQSVVEDDEAELDAVIDAALERQRQGYQRLREILESIVVERISPASSET